MTEVTNNLRYLDLQRQLWQYHYDLGLNEGRRRAQLLNNYAKQHNTCRAYSYLKHVIEKRQKSIVNQIHRIIDELQQYLLKLEEHARQWKLQQLQNSSQAEFRILTSLAFCPYMSYSSYNSACETVF